MQANTEINTEICRKIRHIKQENDKILIYFNWIYNEADNEVKIGIETFDISGTTADEIIEFVESETNNFIIL